MMLMMGPTCIYLQHRAATHIDDGTKLTKYKFICTDFISSLLFIVCVEDVSNLYEESKILWRTVHIIRKRIIRYRIQRM